jgi:hypothetical protein
MLGPIDLIYVCGNRFLVTNSTGGAAQVEYRVVGTEESGKLTLDDGSDEHAGYSELELRTKAEGPVELYRDGDRVARRRNERRPCGPAPFSGSIAAATAEESGNWSAPFSWNGVATHLNLLPTGKVLSFGETVAPQVWDPKTGDFKTVPSPVVLFCGGHSFLADGRLLVAGGHITTDRGFPDLTIFSPEHESWTSATPMRRGRWYPTNTTLASGDVLIIAGRDEAGARVNEPEVWSGGATRELTSAALESPTIPAPSWPPTAKSSSPAKTTSPDTWTRAVPEPGRRGPPAGTGSATTVRP